ncbi:MAG: hypothetical protein ACR2MZ_09310, partial [Candidatus Dormibacter sp.]|uniref:hypothetical protein n=1 Tax=Candidatus Dormibacter sp. TaxID=2973982 RepID=UPI003D9B8E29
AGRGRPVRPGWTGDLSGQRSPTASRMWSAILSGTSGPSISVGSQGTRSTGRRGEAPGDLGHP